MDNPVVQVTAALIEKKGCYLVALRHPGDEHGGLWEFPGGKIEPGETPEACLKREILEELSMVVEVRDFLFTTRHASRGKTIELMAYRAKWISGSPCPNEHAALRWMEPSRFHEIAWSPADLPT